MVFYYWNIGAGPNYEPPGWNISDLIFLIILAGPNYEQVWENISDLIF